MNKDQVAVIRDGLCPFECCPSLKVWTSEISGTDQQLGRDVQL